MNASTAEKRVETALENNSTLLDLTGLNLHELPANFKKIAQNLEILNLEENDFQTVPNEIDRCVNLSELHLSGNSIKRFSVLKGLPKLEILTIRDNELTDFPNEILDCRSLVKLFLGGNKIARIPSGISYLRNLTEIGITNNRIESLPSSIAEMANLQFIHLSGNPLRTPPLEVAMQGVEAIRRYFDDLTRNEQRQEATNHLLAIGLEFRAMNHDVYHRPGAEKETLALVEVLRDRYNFSKTKTLLTAAATRENIMQALADLVNSTGPDDQVVLYFNGFTGDARSECDFFPFDAGYIGFSELASRMSSMRARHVLLIVDNHFYASQLAAVRAIRSDSVRDASRWAFYRTGAEYDLRFTPHLVNWLKTNRLDVAPREIAAVLTGVFAGPLNMAGDEGGEMGFVVKEQVEQTKDKASSKEESSNLNALDIIKETTRSMISEGDTRRVFELIEDNLTGKSERKNDIRLLKSQYLHIEAQLRRGMIDPAESRASINRINAALLGLINDLNYSDFGNSKLEDLEKLQYQIPQPGSLNNADKEKIPSLITNIESLRQQVLSNTDTETRRQLDLEMQAALEELKNLRERLTDTPEVSSQESIEAQNIVFEEELWKKTSLEGSIAGYQLYLDTALFGLYGQEAQIRINELQLLEKEEQIVAEIRLDPTTTLINDYLTSFPSGKYRTEVEQIKGKMEADDVALWEAAEAANTVEAYKNYLSKNKTQAQVQLALSRIEQLSSKRGHIIREAKLIFVGNGRVGKTSISKVLSAKPFDPKEPSTHGVLQTEWDITLPDEQQLRLNVWDFGGQEIYHNTHRFFLTARALYLLVWDAATRDGQTRADDEKKEENFNLDYWLENVRTLGKNAPVLMVQNVFNGKKDYLESPKSYIETYNVTDFCDVSASEGEKIPELRQLIALQFKSASSLKDLIGYTLPDNWYAIRQQLEALADQEDGQPYLKLDDYLEHCEKVGLKEENAIELSRFLTEIGTLLHFPDNEKLRQMVILRPRWATDLIYQAMNKQVKTQQGRFTKKDLAKEWGEFSTTATFPDRARFRDQEELDIFLELMRNFEICFELQEEEGTFIVPQFLPTQRPDIQWDSKKAFRCGFQYSFLHRGLIARAIVRLGDYASTGYYWRNGLRFDYEAAAILIEADYEQRVLRVEIRHEKPEFVEKFMLKTVFEKVNKDLNPKSVLFCPECHKPLLREDVEKLNNKGAETTTCPHCKDNVLLTKIFQSTAMNDDTLNIFISYAHKDEKYKTTLHNWLKQLKWKGELNIWNDRDILPGANWKADIETQLAKADIVLMLISPDFMISEFIENVELTPTIERHDKGETLIVPVIIRPCHWQDLPTAKIQVLPKDGKPVSKHKDKDDAWLEVTQKIKARLKERFGWGSN